jgi:hypothetical protein
MNFNTTQVKENYIDTQTMSRKYTQEGRKGEKNHFRYQFINMMSNKTKRTKKAKKILLLILWRRICIAKIVSNIR